MSDMRAMKNGKPFSWQEKDVLRQIQLMYDGSSKELTSAMALYLILTFVASNKATDSFDVTRAALSGYSGLSFPTIDTRLKDFEKLGIVKIKRDGWGNNKKRVPLVITLNSS
ncbi:MAG: hypothetical protein HQ507_06925 [Candidatus Marinimicrobia bacterium]|nr:hypothetical protein [Candidatus Neomarinimicrobiota bacterium]